MDMRLPLMLGVLLVSGNVLAHSGKAVFDQTCVTCHGTGALGAPKLGDRAAWAPRIAQGKKVLLDHADYGFKSMPPHGGNDDLSDKDIEAAVDYMVQQAGGDGKQATANDTKAPSSP